MKIMLGPILTIDNLQRRGKILVNRCYSRSGIAETLNHLLLHYSSYCLWYIMLEFPEMSWVPSVYVAREVGTWHGIQRDKHMRRLISYPSHYHVDDQEGKKSISVLVLSFFFQWSQRFMFSDLGFLFESHPFVFEEDLSSGFRF